MGNDDWAGWGRPQGPVSGGIDAPLTPSSVRASQAPASNHQPGRGGEILQALKDTLRFLRSANTDSHSYVDAHTYHSDGPDVADTMTELLKELEALKSRDASSATVLRMAKDNLEQRKDQIAQLQAELDFKTQTAGMTSAQQSDDLQKKSRLLQESMMREKAANEMVRKLEEQLGRSQGDMVARKEQDEHMQDLLHEVEAQRDVHKQEIASMRAENQRLLAHKADEMDKVLQEAALEVESVRAGIYACAMHVCMYARMRACSPPAGSRCFGRLHGACGGTRELGIGCHALGGTAGTGHSGWLT
jgi:hypothetical protein